MKFIKSIINKNDLFKYFSNLKKKDCTKKIDYNKKTLKETIKSNENKEFDIYKYFLLPPEERKYYRW